MPPVSDIHDRARMWVDAGLIEQVQAEQIVAHELERLTTSADATSASSPAQRAAPPAVRDRVAGTLGTIGGLLVGLGVLLTVAANWESIGDTAKLLTILVAMLLAYALAMRADVRNAPRWVGTVGYVVGTLVFSGGIFLLGQVYNVRAHDPFGFLVIAITASAVAVLSGRRMVGWIAAAAWLAWSVHEVVVSMEDAADDRASFVILGASMLLGVAALGIGWVLDGIADRASHGTEDNEDDARPIRADLDTLGSPFRGVAYAGMLAVLVPASFAWHLDEQVAGAVSGSPQIIASGVVAFVAAALVARLSTLDARRWTAIGLMLLAGCILLGVLTQQATLVGLLANLILAGGGLGLAVLGLSEDRRDAYAWGVTWIVALIAARYIDVMVSVELGGLGFIGAGLLLLGCAWMVGRSRRIWLEREAT